MKNETKLLNCSFCGGEAEMGRKRSCFDNWEQGDFIPRCKNTKCLGRLYRTYKTEEEAIDAWNTRKPMERILGRLEQKKKDAFDTAKAYELDGWWGSVNLKRAGAFAFEKAIEIVKEEGGIE